MKDGKIEYKFKCGIEAYQEELTLEQDEKLTVILSSINITDSDIKIKEVFDVIATEKIINKFLNIILTAKDKDTDYSKLKNSELRAVVDDFFILNPAVKSLLQTLDGALNSKRTNRSTFFTEQSSGD